MIEKEELVTALSGMLDGDLSEIEYIADDLLAKFVLFERPDVGAVETSADGSLTLGGLEFSRFSMEKIETWEKESTSFAETEIVKILEARTLLEQYRRIADEAKARRREEVTKEIGGDTFEELPGMVRTLVWRLVDAEAANERK